MSITPNSIGDFTRWQTVEAFTNALKLISKANGYNTSPLITRDRRKVENAEEQFVVSVDEGAESMLDKRNSQLEISVSGYVKVGDDDPVKLRSMLLQDVRTAIMADLNGLAGNIGTGCAITLGRSETDEGLFLDEGWAVFEQQFLVTYPQGTTW